MDRMFHIHDSLYKSCGAILNKYLGTGGYGQPALPQAQIKQVAKVLSVELLPMIISELHRALTELGKQYAVPHVIKLEKKDA